MPRGYSGKPIFTNYMENGIFTKLRFGELNLFLFVSVVACSNVTAYIMSFVQYNELEFLFGLGSVTIFLPQ